MIQENNLIEKAARMAVCAHDKQKRKEDDSPFIVHLFMVALKLARFGFKDVVIAAGLLHDVLEDTKLGEGQLRKELGDEILAIVKIITEDRSLLWEERKKKYIETVRNGPEGAKAVSVADKIHNLESLISAYEEQGPDLWKKFNRGKDKKIWFEEEMLKMLKETWQHPLVDEYEGLLAQAKALM